MKARPILFSAPMVRALLDGSKTQARWIVKPSKKFAQKYPLMRDDVMARNEYSVWWWDGVHDHVGASQRCPYGIPGDLLWARETWGLSGDLADLSLRDYRIEDSVSMIRIFGGSLKYRADRDGYDEVTQSWRPSIHMPRWASRLALRITDVRVERVQDISEEDARAEGVDAWGVETGRMNAASQVEEVPCYREPFRELWNSINGPDAWLRNDWVWVVSFDVLQQNVDDVLGEAA